jgi:hypothetical protein
MKIWSRHERVVSASPERIAALITEFDRVWPTEVGPAPRPLGDGLYDVGVMRWEEFDRPGAARAFRVVSPAEFQGEHWFELEPADGATTVRHTVDGWADGAFEAVWTERIAPRHDVTLERLLDKLEAAVGPKL